MAKIHLLVLLLLVTTLSEAALDCPEEWHEFGSSCYKLMKTFGHSRKFDWLKALRVCWGFGGNLASIANEKEMDFVNSLSSELKNDRAWIGLFYRFQKGAYVWSDGMSFNNSVYVNWLDDKPSNTSQIKCVELMRNGWNLTECCKENQYFICERVKGPLACPAGWFLDGSSCYRISDKQDSRNIAQQDCTASGSNLVKIDDDDEHRFMIRYMDITRLKDTIDNVWISSNKNTKCEQMNTNDGTTIEEKCDRPRYYVCEKPAPGISCYQCPNNMSSSSVAVNCTFPENLCFMHSIKTENGEKVIVSQGCMSADQCRRNKYKHLECCEGDLCNKVNKPTESAPENSTSASIFVYIVSSGVAFILLLLVSIGIGLWCYKRSHHKKIIERSARSRREIIPLDKWEILPEQIEYEEELGRGAFGVVHKATFRKRVGIEVFDNGKQTTWLQDPKKALQVVAVKVLHDDPTESQKEEFMFEIAQMKLLGSHQNVISLVGCYTLQEHKFLVIEYVPFGDLLKWLRRRRKLINKQQASEKCYDDREALKDQGEPRKFDQDDECKIDMELLTIPSTSHRNSPTENLEEDDIEEEDGFSTQMLFSFAWQIAKGMNHLAENDFVHRDLAARNVLVGRDNQVKVSDFGLMRQIYEDVYSSKKTNKLPVKWMSPESLYEGIYTIKSDVWAYGVLLWEMATLGGVPYPTLTNTELYQLLNTGYRMERPDMCCDEVHELMTECWKEDPSTRPSFSLLIEKLEVIMQRDVPYCGLRRHDESSPYYNVPYGASASATDESKL